MEDLFRLWDLVLVLSELQFIVSMFTALGLGGVLGAYFRHKFEHRKNLMQDLHKLKRKRYGAILIQMLTLLDPEHGLSKTQKYRPDFEDTQDIMEELKVESLNSVLFASDEVIETMAEFIDRPSYDMFIRVASSMRRDLWSEDTSIDAGILGKFSLEDPVS